MSIPITPIRRVVTGINAQGRSKVTWDGPAPNANEAALASRTNNTNIWVWDSPKLALNGDRDEGDTPYEFPGPKSGGHVRVVETLARVDNYDPATDPDIHPVHEPTPRPSGRSWDRGAKNSYSSGMHKTASLDFGIMLSGEREMILDDGPLLMQPGDIAIQLGSWHNWSSPRGCIMAFDMMDAHFIDGAPGLLQGTDSMVAPDLSFEIPDGVKRSRRIVAGDNMPGRSTLLADTVAPDIRLDPARPGFAAERLWVSNKTPANIVRESLHFPHTIEPPSNGTLCRIYTIPPDENWSGKVGKVEVEAYFRAMGSPGASTFSLDAPHPFMQKTQSMDFCFVLEGQVTLVLDEEAVHLKSGDVVIQRGTNHAWSNASPNPCRIAVSSHDGAYY